MAPNLKKTLFILETIVQAENVSVQPRILDEVDFISSTFYSYILEEERFMPPVRMDNKCPSTALRGERTPYLELLID